MTGPRPSDRSLKGRAARSNRSGRFESLAREEFDDGWDAPEDDVPRRVDATVLIDHPRTVIARNNSPDVGFDRSINPYRGCEHGCIYCYARPAHPYLGLSPGLDFETRIFAKTDAAETLRRELSSPRYRCAPIHIGGDTDPYQPIERRLGLTRQIIEVLGAFRHPFSIITKSALIQRDLDLLGPLARQDLVKAAVSVTTLDRRLARSMEPRAATPERRIETIRRLSEAGVPVTVMFAPVIPGLNDHELEAVLETAARAGARGAGYVALRLPRELSSLFREWLEAEQPDRAGRVMSLVRQMRGGRDYDADWAQRMTGQGPLATLLRQRFRTATKRLGLNQTRHELDVSLFVRPPRAGDQLDLFCAPQSEAAAGTA